MEKPIELAIKRAKETMNNDIGGPFGAAIVDSSGKIIAVASNTVLGDKDPTAHAEVNAIRKAVKEKGTHDLSGCVLYTTAYPCPMCLGAIIWANIKKCYFGCEPKDAEEIGFRDDFIYRFIENGCNDSDLLQFIQTDREECLELFKEYAEKEKELY